MAIENINDYAGMWANGVNIGQMWDLIKAKFVSGAHNQSGSAYTQEWRVRARNNIGLPSLAAGQMWYAQGQDLLSVIDTTAMGRGLLNKGITLNAIWYGSATNTIDEIITSQVGRDVLVTTGASAVANLWATKATTDSRDSVIINTYGTDLAFDGNTLKLKNNASTKAFIGTGIETNANNGLVRLTGGKIPLSVFPDAILGQLTFGGNISSYDSTDDGLVVSLTDSAKAILEERSGKSLTDKVVVLVATSTKPADSGVYVFFNYADCKGMYFIWKESALESHTGETVKYRIWPSGGPRYQAGDWMNSLESEWDKVDNTDAVTGVKGNAESVYRLGLVNITAQNVRALDTGLPNEIQNVQGKVEFEKDIWSLGGIAAYGVSDLSMGAGGGGGLSGSILRNWASYDPNDETQILGSNLGIESFRMSGAKFQYMRNKTWTDGFTLADSNIPDLPLTKITGTDDLRAIEALTGTGILKRTGNNTWALRDAAGLRSDAGITGDIYTHNYSEFVTAVSISGTNLSVTKNGQSTTTAINAATLQGHAADYFATQEAFEGAVSTLSGGIGQVLAMAQDNAENIGLHDDRITDLESYFDGASVKNALALEGHGASYFGTASAVSTLQGYFTNGVANNADKVDGHHASEFVGALGVSGNNLTWTRIGGTAQTITIPYASNAGQLGGHSSDWYQQKVTALGSATQPVYISATGTFSAGSTYAGGTKVTLNGSDKGASTASFYAPAAAGTSGYWLKSSGSGAPVWESQANMLAGRATRMEQETMQETQEFIFRNSPKTIGADSLKLDRILGRTVAWNQLIDDSGYALVGSSGCTFSMNNHILTITGTATATCVAGFYNAKTNLINGHKYAFVGFGSRVGSNSTFEYMVVSTVSSAVEKNIYQDGIFEYTGTTKYNCEGQIVVRNGYNTNTLVVSPNLFDLTLMFGAGHEPSTVAEFEALYPNAYYEYNSGQLINNSAEGLETVGFNIWDEVVFKGTFSSEDGETKSVTDNFLSTENKVSVIPGKSYYIKVPAVSFRTLFYDANKKFITSVTNISPNTPFVMPDGVYYIRIQMGYQGAYNNDICINLSNPAKNGTYVPYKRNVLDLHLEEFKVKDSQGNIITITGGLKQAGDVRDEIVGGKYIRRVESVDLGTSTYTLASGGHFTTPLGKAKIGGSTICSKYITARPTDIVGNRVDKAVAVSGTGNVFFVRDSDYNDAATFQAAMNGVMLNYELATYETYELVSPIPTAMPAGTTERRLPEDTSDSVLAPFACDMTYGTNPGDILASGVAWEKIWGRPTLEKGSLSDALVSADANNGEWFKLEMGGQILYVKFVVGDGAFKLQLADNDQNPTLSKEFEFATLSTADINAICV